MNDPIDWAKAVSSTVKDYVGRAVTALSARMDGFEQSLREIPAGKDGVDGKSVTLEEIRPLMEEMIAAKEVKIVASPGSPGEPGASGKDGRNAFEVAVSLGYEGTVHDWMASLAGKAGERGEKGEPGESIEGQKGEPGADGKSVTLEDIRPLIEQSVRAISPAKDGEPGKDGASVTIDDVLPLLKAQLHQEVEMFPLPKDGKDGADGKDGKSVTVDDIRSLLEAEQAKWALEFERRATDLIQRCIDRIEKPKDGKDGRDGLSLENFDVSLGDDERTMTIALIGAPDIKVERSIRLNHPIYRGIYKAGESYQRGDSVTFGGSQFIAMSDTNSKPETDDTWKLAVKRGRDGAPGVQGPRGPEGPKGKDNWQASAR